MIPPEQRTTALAWIGAFLTIFGCVAFMADCSKRQGDGNRAAGYAVDMFGNVTTVHASYESAVRADGVTGYGPALEGRKVGQ